MKEAVMNRRLVSIALAALLAIAAIGAVGVYEYRAGVAHGLEMSGKLPTGPAGYPYWPGYFHPLGFFFPLLLVFLIFALVRRSLWWGGWRGREDWRRDRKARLDEWHRKAHESMAGEAR